MFINKIQRLLFLLFITINSVWADPSIKEELAYLRLSEGYWQVWLSDAKGQSHRQVTYDAVDKSRVSWFPDRSRLLVNSNDGSLVIVDISTLKTKSIALDSLEVFDAKLSPDGKQIAYTSTTSLQADNAEVWVANIDGTQKQKITNNTSVTLTPTWSVQNKAILFSAGKPGSNQELWSVSLEDKKAEQVTVAKSTSIDPAANSEGDILYSSNRAGNYSIWILDRNTKQSQLTRATGFDAQPSWAPNNKAFAFYRISGVKKQIWVHDLLTGNEYPITPENALSRYPSWVE